MARLGLIDQAVQLYSFGDGSMLIGIWPGMEYHVGLRERSQKARKASQLSWTQWLDSGFEKNFKG